MLKLIVHATARSVWSTKGGVAEPRTLYGQRASCKCCPCPCVLDAQSHAPETHVPRTNEATRKMWEDTSLSEAELEHDRPRVAGGEGCVSLYPYVPFARKLTGKFGCLQERCRRKIRCEQFPTILPFHDTLEDSACSKRLLRLITPPRGLDYLVSCLSHFQDFKSHSRGIASTAVSQRTNAYCL